MCQYCKALGEAIDRYIAKADDDLADVLDDEGYADPKGTVSYIETIESQLETALVAETAYIVAESEQYDTLEQLQNNLAALRDNDTVDEAITDTFKKEFTSFMPQYVKHYLKKTDRSLRLTQITKRTTAWIDSWSEDLGTLMKLNSHAEIETILKTGLENGDGIAEFVVKLQESGIRNEYYKARRAALTEILTAHRVAQQEAFLQSPSVEQKMWRHTGEYRNQPRRNHQDMDGQIVPKNQPYTLKGIKGGTYYPMVPGDTSLPPEERINCHCISQGIVNQDILGLSLERRKELQQKAIDEMDDAWEKELDAQNKAKAGIDE